MCVVKCPTQCVLRLSDEDHAVCKSNSVEAAYGLLVNELVEHQHTHHTHKYPDAIPFMKAALNHALTMTKSAARQQRIECIQTYIAEHSK